MVPEFYQNHTRVLVAVDCIIFGFHKNQLKLLLIKRDFEPEKGKWSLMGGFLKKRESLDDAAARILVTLTGLQDIYLDQLHSFGAIDRDPVERTVSVAYYALIDVETHDKELLKKHSASWFPIDDVPKLIFDHANMVREALKKLRFKATHQPVGFELLPEKFTLPELQKLYECIYNTSLDKRNFRRRILSMDVLIKTEEKQKAKSRKGAFLYQFDQKKYVEKVTNGDSTIFKPLRA